jgi:hypothetical protein
MNERAKIAAVHLSRQAIVYLRQLSAAQVEHNRESTERQYALAAKARELGWPADRILMIDEDLAVRLRLGCTIRLCAAQPPVALAHVGLVLGLEVSRLVRNNADWYRLIDLAGLTDTRIGDADGSAATTTARDKKELIGTLIEEVIVKVERDKSAAHLTLRWKGGALTEIDLALRGKRLATVRTARCSLTERQLRHRRLPPPPPDPRGRRTVRCDALVSSPRTTRRDRRQAASQK